MNNKHLLTMYFLYLYIYFIYLNIFYKTPHTNIISKSCEKSNIALNAIDPNHEM